MCWVESWKHLECAECSSTNSPSIITISIDRSNSITWRNTSQFKIHKDEGRTPWNASKWLLVLLVFLFFFGVNTENVSHIYKVDQLRQTKSGGTFETNPIEWKGLVEMTKYMRVFTQQIVVSSKRRRRPLGVGARLIFSRSVVIGLASVVVVV